jgi:hypothetical protein
VVAATAQRQHLQDNFLTITIDLDTLTTKLDACVDVVSNAAESFRIQTSRRRPFRRE